ncbi:non-ribosomal peptide synthetase [Gynuella sunshinyii]|uniref:Non-ribosomal peptide synthetase modules-related protein n=1 Tax=Gynuella sunshinyii YC6258 TaxID=1445510 RepID=A0A0C5VLD3_9GAMM|nr:non-ribosomal peptide synthetase [Gynuella sunshinyii]AJQ94153.1 non-ribosomal peptide synthetase modules-related protein [Gynuella sunshinyii YC6258]
MASDLLTQTQGLPSGCEKLTSSQQAVYLDQIINPEVPAYNIGIKINCDSRFEPDSIRAAVEALCVQHAFLRAVLVEIEGEVLQKTSGDFKPEIEFVDYSGIENASQEGDEYLKQRLHDTYDLFRAGWRAVVVKVNDHYWKILLCGHHLFLDGVSVVNLFEGFLRNLEQLHLGVTFAQLTQASDWSYRDYIQEDQAYRASARYQKDKQFWQQKYQTIPDCVLPPVGVPSKATDKSTFERVYIPRAVYNQLEKPITAHGLSMAHFAIALIACYYARLKNLDELVIGVPVHNRTKARYRHTIGMFASMMPVRLRIDKGQSFLSLLEEVSREVRSGFRAQRFPVAEINRLCQLSQIGRRQLFDISVSYESKYVESDYAGGTFKGITMPLGYENTPAALALKDHYEQGDICLELNCNSLFVEADEVLRVCQRLKYMAEVLSEGLNKPIAELPIVTPDEQHDQVHTLNQSFFAWRERQPDRPKLIHELFDECAGRYGDQPAVQHRPCEGTEELLGYQQLRTRVDRVARYLCEREIPSGSIVGVYLSRRADLLAVILGILKAGCAYLPLSVETPVDRVIKLTGLTRSPLLLVDDQTTVEQFAGDPAMVVVTADNALAYDSSAVVTFPVVHPNDLAYVTFTSGSTGEPKGVMVQHDAIQSIFQAWRESYPLSPGNCRILQMANVNFDVFSGDWVRALCSGNTLILCDRQKLLSPAQLYQELLDCHITFAEFVPAVLRSLVEYMITEGLRFPPLDMLVVGSDSWYHHDTKQLLSVLGEQTRFINSYGATEAAVDSTWYEIHPDQAFVGNMAPIGKPFANTCTYVLDDNGQCLPFGSIGELYIGGPGVSLGYLNQPELTAEKFVQNPFLQDGSRCYRTGDMVRYLADGNIEYIGRTDNQIKINGYRIELAEIEDQLAAIEFIKHAVVTGQKNHLGTPRLVAYIELQDDISAGLQPIPAIKETLNRNLPKYMVPAAFKLIDQWPLSANGKVDKKALSTIDADIFHDDYLPPVSAAEKILTDIWAKLFRIDAEQLSINANFFELGGDSILSIQVVSRASAAGLKLTIKQVFEHQTIAELAASTELRAATVVDQSPVTGSAPLLPIQMRFFDDETGLDHYNQSILLTTTPAFDPQCLPALVQALYQRHDVLRLRFHHAADGWQAEHLPLTDERLHDTVDIVTLPTVDQELLQTVCDQAHQSLSVGDGPLLKLVYIGQADAATPGYLFMTVHHLVVDGVSWRILLEDIHTLLDQHKAGKPLSLAAKTTSYQTWGRFLHEYARSEVFIEHLNYWHEVSLMGTDSFQAAAPVITETPPKSTGSINIGFDAELTGPLIHQAGRRYRTNTTELLLSALYLAIYRLTGCTRVAVDLEHHGRENLSPEIDLSETVGWFTSLYPHVPVLSSSFDWHDPETLICEIKESVRRIPVNGIGYGLCRYLLQDAAVPPQADIAFNYLGRFEALADGRYFSAIVENYGQVSSHLRQPEHGLTFDGWVKDEALQFTLNYDTTRYNEAFVQSLADQFAAAVRELTGHCVATGHGRLTPSDIDLTTVSRVQLQAWQQQFEQQNRTLVNVYPASMMQQGMLFHSLFDKSSYHTQLLFELSGEFDTEAFHRAWQQVLERHDILRTCLVAQQDGQWQQLVFQGIELPWRYADISDQPEAEQHQLIEEYRLEDKRQGFDLSDAPLMRVAVWKTAARCHQILLSQHHILTDGWSMPLILSELLALYAAGLTRQPCQLASPVPYHHFIRWQLQQDSTRARHYWQQQLADFQTPTPLPGQLTRSGGAHPHSPGYTHLQVVFSPAETARLSAFARQTQTTVNIVLQAAWACLLSSYSHETTVTFGVTTSGRPAELPGVETMVGLFINTLPVMVDVPADVTIADWLQQLHQTQVGSEEFSYLPFAEINRLVDKDPHTPLFDSLLVFENYPSAESLDHSLEAASLQLTGLHNYEETNFPLTVVATLGETLALDLGFLAGDFDADIMNTLPQRLKQMILQVTDDARQPLAAISPVDAVEQQQLLNEFNRTARPFADQLTMHQWFEQQVQASPDHCAVICGDERLSYRQLDERANQLAHLLRARQVGANTPVGLACYRSLEMIIGLWGILKAGGAYVPLEPDYPIERLQDIVDTSGLQWVLTHQSAGVKLQSVTQIVLDEGSVIDQLDAQSTAAITEEPACATDLAYIIFTSGSTGKPKGVMIEHRALVNRIDWMQREYGLDHNDVVLQKTPFSFDVSVWEFTWPLVCGATLVVARPEGHKDPHYLQAISAEHRVTTLHFVPSMLRVMLESGQWSGFSSVRQVFCSGEALTTDLVERHYQQHHAALHNLYGPTEAAIDVSYFPCQAAPAGVATTAVSNVSIGWPIQNIQLYILGRQQQLLPVGAVGELYIGGVGLARGYARRDDLTDERFVQVSLTDAAPVRLYRTGDLARWRADGSIDYLGRMDDQVKIRGLRIELTEVQQHILALAGVRSAAVITRPDRLQQPRIVAYVVGEEGESLQPEQIQTALQSQLPDYMVPAAVVMLAELPVTGNGKLDRKALPDPDFNASGDEYVAPRGELAQRLTQIWSDLLALPAEHISAGDDFFELGGHSLLAIRLMTALRAEFDPDIDIRSVFERSRLQQQAEWLAQRAQRSNRTTMAVPVIQPAGDWHLRDSIPASFAQQRLWFLDRVMQDSAQYHLLAAIEVTGAFRITIAEQALNTILDRHPVLRCQYHGEGEQVFQRINRDQRLTVSRLGHHGAMAAECYPQMAGFVRQPFALDRDLPIRAGWLETADDAGVLLLAMHHIAFDGWSMTLLAQEFSELYSAALEQRPAQLPAVELSYFDYAVWQRDFLNADQPALQAQLEYWQTHLQGIPEVHSLVTDFPRQANQQHIAGRCDIHLDQSLLQDLKILAGAEKVSLFMLLHAGFSVLLSRYANDTDIVMGTPVAGRLQKELENVIGMFVNTLVLRADCRPEQTFRQLLHDIRDTHLSAQQHQDVPFEWLVEQLNPGRSAHYSPIIQIMLSMNNNQPIDMQLPDLQLTLHDGQQYLQRQAAEALEFPGKFELLLNVEEQADSLLLVFEYSRALWQPETMARLADSFATLLRAIVDNSDRRLDELPLCASAEGLSAPMVAHERGYGPEDSIARLFEQYADRSPEQIALVAAGQHLSYGELNRRANQLARHLQTLGAAPGALIGTCLPRSPELIVALLAILKTGAAYVPLDPDYPPSRLDYMLSDSQLSILIQSAAPATSWTATGVKVCTLDATLQQALDQLATDNPDCPSQAADAAYINYTSGSTGQPKGVITPHRGVLRLVRQCRFMTLDEQTRFLQLSSISFDAATLEIWGPLLNGGSLVLYPAQAFDIQILNQLIRQHDINSLWLTSALFDLWSHAEGLEHCHSLRWIAAGGDVVNPQAVRRVYERLPEATLINGYGPTENTTFTCCYAIPATHPAVQALPLGTPVNGTRVHILDRHQQPLPQGAIGELYAGGEGLALGYLHQPELTRERFIDHPQFGRIYRSGDLVRVNHAGQVEFVGRVDDQVKIRGYRIEPGEIERRLLSHPAVQAAVVVVVWTDDAQQKDLVAYLVATDPQQTESAINAARTHLREQLPAYMVPAFFMALDEIPVTRNGKVDRGALPRPVISAIGSTYVEPVSATEQQLCAIWSRLLKADAANISATDDFFDLGGHSLLSIKLQTEIKEHFDIEIPVVTIFEASTLNTMAANIDILRIQHGMADDTATDEHTDREIFEL